MARQPRTPGATTEAPKATETEVVATTTADQADAALNAILGTPDAESTSTPSEPVQEGPTNAELLEIINGLKAQIANQAAAPAEQHVPASGVGVAKRTRQVLTDKGWDSKEY